VLLAAIAVCIVAVLAGLAVAARSAIRAARALARLDEAVTTGKTLVVRAREASDRAARLRARIERLRI
jgi:hypothetical protein